MYLISPSLNEFCHDIIHGISRRASIPLRKPNYISSGTHCIQSCQVLDIILLFLWQSRIHFMPSVYAKIRVVDHHLLEYRIFGQCMEILLQPFFVQNRSFRHSTVFQNISGEGGNILICPFIPRFILCIYCQRGLQKLGIQFLKLIQFMNIFIISIVLLGNIIFSFQYFDTF